MGKNDVNQSRDSQKEMSPRAKAGGNFDLIRHGAAVATAALLVTGAAAADRVESFSKSGSTSSALGRRSDKLTGLDPAFSDQRAVSTSASSLSPQRLEEGLKEYNEKYGKYPFTYADVLHSRKMTPGGETSLGFRSRKMTPGGETSRSATDVPLDQQKQSKGIEALKLSRKEIDSLKPFLDSLEQNKAALQGFKKVVNDGEVMERINNLMQDPEFRKCALHELKNEESIRQAISSLESGQAASLLKNKEVVEICKQITENDEIISKNKQIERRILQGGLGGTYSGEGEGDGTCSKEECWKVVGITLGAIVGLVASCCCCCYVCSQNLERVVECGESIGNSVRGIGNRVRECIEPINNCVQELQSSRRQQAVEGQQVSGPSVEMQPTLNPGGAAGDNKI